MPEVIIPEGVAVEKLDGGKRKLSEQCPPRLQRLLERKQATAVYNELVQAIVQASQTRSVFGKWRDMEFVNILNQFKDEFADKHIKVVLCKQKLALSETRRWLEFIDIDVAQGYVPQCDVSNLSGQVIKTAYSTLEFPFGVYVEELHRYGAANRKILKEKIPVLIEELMNDKGLMKQYDALVDAFVQADKGKLSKWKTADVEAVVRSHNPQFQAKGVEIFFCHCEEFVSHGKVGHTEYYRWLEFVDRNEQPNYYPQHEQQISPSYCVIS